MSISSIITIVVAIIVAVILIRVLTKIVAKILAVLLILVALWFILFQWHGGLLNLGRDEFILYDLQEEYCVEKADTAICECVVMVILEDIESQYTPEELSEISKSRSESIDIILESYRKNSEQISNCLKEKDAGIDMEEMMKKIKKLNLDLKIRERLKQLESDDSDAEPATQT
jgi:hypothetical protein